VTVESSELVTVAENACVPAFASTLALVGFTVTTTGLGHPSALVAMAGALVVAELVEMTTSAVS